MMPNTFSYEYLASRVFGNCSELSNLSRQMGALLKFRTEMPHITGHSIMTIRNILLKAITDGHVHICYDGDGSPLGYAIWGYTDSIDTHNSGRIWLSRDGGKGRNHPIYLIDIGVRKGKFKHFMASFIRVFDETPQYIKYKNNSTRKRKFNVVNSARIKNLTSHLSRHYCSTNVYDEPNIDNGECMHYKFAASLMRKRNQISVYYSFQKFYAVSILGEILFNTNIDDISDVDYFRIFMPQIYTESFKLLRSANGELRSYIIWGWLTDHSISEADSVPLTSLHPFAFNEGGLPCILSSGGEREGVLELIEQWLNEVNCLDRGCFLYPKSMGNNHLIHISPDDILSRYFTI